MKIEELLLDPAAVADGVWLAPLSDRPEVRIKARARGPSYFKREARMRAEWARIYQDVTPDHIARRFNADAAFEECIVEFEGIAGRDGSPLPYEEAKRLCGLYAGHRLFGVFLAAIDMATARTEADAAAAVGNSLPASDGISNGDTSAPS